MTDPCWTTTPYLVHQAGQRREYDALIREWMGSYDGLFKVPVLHPPSFDGTRDTSGSFQMEVDQIIDRLLEEFEVPHHRLDPQERDGWVDAVIRAVGLPPTPPQIDFFG